MQTFFKTAEVEAVGVWGGWIPLLDFFLKSLDQPSVQNGSG